MSPEERELLEKSVELAVDNNKILHSIRRSMRLAHIASVVYWMFILGSAIGLYYFIQPYLGQISDIYGGAKNNLESVNTFLQSFKE